MAVTPAEHAVHTAGIASTRSSFNLPPLNDLQLNKSGTVGTEPIQSPNGKTYTEVKLGKLGKVDVPTARTIAGDVKSAVSKGVANVKQNASMLKQSIAKNGGINPFGLKKIARGNVKP